MRRHIIEAVRSAILNNVAAKGGGRISADGVEFFDVTTGGLQCRRCGKRLVPQKKDLMTKWTSMKERWVSHHVPCPYALPRVQ
jgi:hypothetical protein